MHEASASSSQPTKEFEVSSKSNVSGVTFTSGTSQSSSHADSSQVSFRSVCDIQACLFPVR